MEVFAGITNLKLDGVVAYFPTKSLKSARIFTMMDVVMEIEMKSAAQCTEASKWCWAKSLKFFSAE